MDHLPTEVYHYNRAILLIPAAITLYLITTSITFTPTAMAFSKGGGSVAQEQVTTGNSNLDKEINQFYSCISKTHQDPPTIEKVDSCYYQSTGSDSGGVTSGSNQTTISDSPSGSSGHHHTHESSSSKSDMTGTGTGTGSLPKFGLTQHHHKK